MLAIAEESEVKDIRKSRKPKIIDIESSIGVEGRDD